MVHRTRDTSRLPEYSPASSDPSRRNHHRKFPKANIYNDEYEEDEQLVNSEGDQFIESDSISNAASNHSAPESITRKSRAFDATVSLNSSSNSPNAFQPINQITSYINIAPLPIFRGLPEECPVTHLSRFSKVCRANNVSSIEMMMKIFPVTLDNEAALWYDLNIEPYPSLTWEEIKPSFLDAYQRNDFTDQFRSELMMLNQGQEEPVRSYFLRLQWILKRWPDHGIPDTLLKGIFVDGLRQEFQDWIIPQKPNSLNDALRLAFTWEQVRSIRSMARKRDVRIESDETVAEEIVRSVSEDGKKKKSQCQCWKHQCWKKKLERDNSIVLSGNSNTPSAG